MSLEEKFTAAVNVIRGLPKSGSYQPSNELMLRFYSYFKQATEGPCDKPKPGFWDVVNRAKWESWNKLGNMTREEAMLAYVDELQKIVETMAYTGDVASFMAATDNDVNPDDLQLLAGDVIQRVISQHNTPLDSPMDSRSASPHDVHQDSDDEFADTIEHQNVEGVMQGRTTQSNHRISNGNAYTINNTGSYLKVLDTLPATLERLEQDVAALRKAVEGDRHIIVRNGGWRWPWQDLSAGTFCFVILWPFVVYRLQRALQTRK